MYMIVILALLALTVVSYMLKGAEEEDDTTVSAGDVYSTRMSTREWFEQRYVPCALDITVVRSIPSVKFCSRISAAAMACSNGSICAVCLNPFQEDEEVKVLPPCQHGFHPPCIDPWFETHSTCPICRSEVASPSAETGEVLATGGKLIHGLTVEIVVD